MVEIDLGKSFDYENAFYLSASPARISKFAAHLDLYRRSLKLPGEIVELGVFKGASLSRFIKFRELFEGSPTRKVIAFDVFGQFPEAQFSGDKEARSAFVSQAGIMGISTDALLEILTSLRLDQNIELIKGDIVETIPEYVRKNPSFKISLLHIDVDLFEPTGAALETFFDHVVQGGIIILDDYGAFAGATKAIDNFFGERPERIQRLDYTTSISFVEKL